MSKTILVVEDDRRFRMLYEDALMDASFRVLTADDGNRALELLRTEKIDGVILDVMLIGDMNGFDVLEEMKRNFAWKEIPVVMLTNLDGEDNTAKAIGVDEYLVKAKVSLEQVVAKVKKLVGDSASN